MNETTGPNRIAARKQFRRKKSGYRPPYRMPVRSAQTRRLWIALFLLAGLCFSASGQGRRAKDPFRIVGYYSLAAATTNSPQEVPFSRLTHVNLWFLNPDTLGNFTQDLSALGTFVDAAHAAGVKVLASIGGGSKQPQYARLLQDDQRKLLIDNLLSVVRAHRLDGIDVDLEGSDISGNYEKFVVELAAALRTQNKLITAAIAVFYKDALTDKALASYDFVNVMSYDHTGPWRPEKPGPHSTYAQAEEDLTYFGRDRSIPREKMNLGLPFYGYGYGPEPDSPAISMNYAEIVNTFPGAERVDEWKMPDGKVLYYNGIPTVQKKTALARKKAAGIMIWQLRGDAGGELSLLKAIHEAAYGKQPGNK
jgi:chitinase